MPLQVLAQRFDLEQLQKQASRYPAPVAFRSYLAIEGREGLERCVKDARWKLKRAEDFFAAVLEFLPFDARAGEFTPDLIATHARKTWATGLFGLKTSLQATQKQKATLWIRPFEI